MTRKITKTSRVKPVLCANCGEPAEVRWRKRWYCGSCLNPEPSDEYLKVERERANGQWGGLCAEAWGRV
jgi:hypothetical protein